MLKKCAAPSRLGLGRCGRAFVPRPRSVRGMAAGRGVAGVHEAARLWEAQVKAQVTVSSDPRGLSPLTSNDREIPKSVDLGNV